MKVFGKQKVANLLGFSIPVCNNDPLQVHLLNKSGDGNASALVRALIQAQTWEKVGTDNQDREALSSVDDATIALRIKRLVMAPRSEAGFAKNKITTTIVEFLPGIISIWKVRRGSIVISSIGWCGKGLPPNSPELPPHLVQVDAKEVAFGDSYNIRLVITKRKFCKVGQGLLVAGCHIDQLDGDAGAITPAAALWKKTQPPRVAACSC